MNLSSRRERSWTHIAVRDGILRNYGDPQTAVAMEVTGICKRIGKCDMFHVAQFVPTFRARRNADFVQLLWFRSKSTLAENWKQKTPVWGLWFSKLENLKFSVHLNAISPPHWLRVYPPHCGPANYPVARNPGISGPDLLPFMLVLCVLWDLVKFFSSYRNSHIVTVWNVAASLL